MKLILITWLFCSISIVSWSQEQLEAYVQEAVQNNQQLLQEAMNVRSSQAALSEASGLFMPSVDFMADYTLADGGRNIQFPVGDLFNPVYGTLNQLTETGSFPTDLENVNEQFLPNDFHDTKIRIVQPLFNADIYYNRRARQRLVEVSEARKAAYEKELIKEVKVAYFNHLQALESTAIYLANIEALEEAERFNQLRFEQDLITRDQVYRVSSQLANTRAEWTEANAQVVNSRSYFNFLLDRPVTSEIIIDSTLSISEFTGEISVERAWQDRQELLQVKAAQEAQHQSIKLAQGSKLPQLNGVLDMGYQGFGYGFENEQQYYLVNFSLSWNIFKGFQNQRKVQRQQIELEVLESQEAQLRRQIALEVTRAYQAYYSAQNRYEAANISIRSASRSFDITGSRYRENQALLVEYLDAQSNYQSAQLQASIAKYALMARKSELERALAY